MFQYLLVIYLSSTPIPVDLFGDQEPCLVAAVKINNYLQQQNQEGMAWCEAVRVNPPSYIM